MRRVVLAMAMAMAVAVGCTPAPEAPAPTADASAPAPAPAPVVAEPAPPATIDPAVAWDNRLGNLPPDAAAVIARVEGCTHFSGEFNGDQSARDREVAAKMAELRCDLVEQDAVAVRAMYGDRPDVIEALAMATDDVR